MMERQKTRWQGEVAVTRIRPHIAGMLGGAALLLVLVAVIWLPGVVHPALTSQDLTRVKNPEKRIELQQAQSQVQSNLRSQLLQCLGGFVVVAGAAVGWRQLRIAHEGQITERISRGIEHLGSDTVDVRLGGIYALERVAKDSSADRQTLTFILCAFVRGHAPWQAGTPDGSQHPMPTVDSQLSWLDHRAPDVWAALRVLGRRPTQPDERPLFLARVDLRRAALAGARLEGANLRHSNLAGAWMPSTNLDRSVLKNADLGQANLQEARLAHADLRRAHLRGADLRKAVLRGADLRGADLSGAQLAGADLTGVRTDDTTVWPEGQRPR
ncbi:pentapeptide repeat-containing protein [Streptomyces sp. ISL-10]|uniref:pentapeptide repeat-containing protein n=1 Tax=Streptomyces sp. ISL-10 TaxID=2819172 RepID=UPI001BE61F58|nr:pentapeptide repeat-containing protein [Streptomyces sp. ISL-10]MBT2365822.1 pentapeptide repeat-containing protein [Streptomyces sp. ISL-10]